MRGSRAIPCGGGRRASEPEPVVGRLRGVQVRGGLRGATQVAAVRLFMSMGETENDTMLGPMRRLATVMTDRHYQGLALSTRIFEGEEPLSTFPVAVTRGLRTVFGETAGR